MKTLIYEAIPCYCSLLQKDWRIICSNNNGCPSIHLSLLAFLYAFIICNYINVYLIGTFLAVLFRVLLRMFPSKLGFRTTVSRITFCSVSQWNPNFTRKSSRHVPSNLTWKYCLLEIQLKLEKMYAFSSLRPDRMNFKFLSLPIPSQSGFLHCFLIWCFVGKSVIIMFTVDIRQSQSVSRTSFLY